MKFDESGLIPAIIQDAATQQVLMLGYMNAESFQLTLSTKRITFFSRSRNELWVKGATSGNYLNLESWAEDCDSDALLFRVIPEGPVCHTGTVSCFGTAESGYLNTFLKLVQTIDDRFSNPKEGSYIQSLMEKGLPKIAQKVGEEGVELVIEAMRDKPGLFLEEAADLLFHFLVLLRAKGVAPEAVFEILEQRSFSRTKPGSE